MLVRDGGTAPFFAVFYFPECDFRNHRALAFESSCGRKFVPETVETSVESYAQIFIHEVVEFKRFRLKQQFAAQTAEIRKQRARPVEIIEQRNLLVVRLKRSQAQSRIAEGGARDGAEHFQVKGKLLFRCGQVGDGVGKSLQNRIFRRGEFFEADGRRFEPDVFGKIVVEFASGVRVRIDGEIARQKEKGVDVIVVDPLMFADRADRFDFHLEFVVLCDFRGDFHFPSASETERSEQPVIAFALERPDARTGRRLSLLWSSAPPSTLLKETVSPLAPPQKRSPRPIPGAETVFSSSLRDGVVRKFSVRGMNPLPKPLFCAVRTRRMY